MKAPFGLQRHVKYLTDKGFGRMVSCDHFLPVSRTCPMMPDFRYRQTTAGLDVHGRAFRAVGRQPIELGWRTAFPEWTPAEEKGDEAQLLPVLRDGEATLLSDPLVEAKGIGTPATRAEIIRGLKAQEFLVAQGKTIVPTERGLALFDVLQKADPPLVDPGVTAQLARLLDEVLIGETAMMGTIDAVCARHHASSAG